MKLWVYHSENGTQRVSLTVFLAGINLLIIQWVAVHELTMLLLGTELVILLVSITYFLGLSIGYAAAGRIKIRWLPALSALALMVHLLLPVAFRYLSGWLYFHNIFWLAFLLLPLIVPFSASAFYSILLPIYVDNGQGHFMALYSMEIAGAILGILLLIGLGGLSLSTLYLVYSVLFIFLVGLLGLDRRRLAVLAIGTSIWLIALPHLDAISNAYWFGAVFNLDSPTTVFSRYSPYQKVDIIDDAHGERYLFLNGLIDYGTPTWKGLNVMLGKIPAKLLHPASMVTVGSGSMALESLAAPFAGHLTTVELDSTVLNASREYFTAVNHINDLTNWSYVIDDAKHYFANTTAHYDLVTMNVPAPLTAQTATLYYASFYASLKSKLNPQGVLAISLTRALNKNDTLTLRIAAGLLANFKHAIAITPKSVGITFIFGGDDLTFDIKAVEQALQSEAEQQYTIMDEDALRLTVGDARPLNGDNFSIVLDESWRRIAALMKPW